MAERHKSSGCEGHEAGYFDFARPELLSLVPPSAERMLEVGCGAGRLGESIKQRQKCEVTGIERNRAAACRAGQRLDRVYVGNVERLKLPFAAGSFDCIICADVLEHLARPRAFLKRARGWLAEDGVLVASIPNVRHHSVVGGLLAGNWTYEPAGLLDRTHRHFFTRRGIEELLSASGFRVMQLGVVPGPGCDQWQQAGATGGLRLGGLAVSGLSREEAEEFFVYQYLVVAELQSAAEDVRDDGRVVCRERPPWRSARGGAGPNLSSRNATVGVPYRGTDSLLPTCVLLMVTYNRLDYTRLALEAVLRLDYPRLKVVIWDNGSTDEASKGDRSIF